MCLVLRVYSLVTNASCVHFAAWDTLEYAHRTAHHILSKVRLNTREIFSCGNRGHVT